MLVFFIEEKKVSSVSNKFKESLMFSGWSAILYFDERIGN
jgi:hypothetical protein